MPIYSSSTINFDYVKVRWQEPYVSNALNRKLFGLLPKGIYAGFTIGPGGLSNRDILITNGSVSGGLGTGLQAGYVSGGFDETVGFSIAIHNDTSGFSTTISIPPTSPAYHLDATGLNGQRVFIVVDAVYAIGNATTAAFYLVNGAQIDANPSYIVIGYCDVPSNPSTPLDLSMFGFNDPTYPRLTPLANAQKAGFMPASAFAQLNQFFAWQNLVAPTLDANSHFIIDISPSQVINTVTNSRIYTYVLPNISSRFPRDSSGNYNGGVNNTNVTTLNIQSGQIGGAHQIPGNTTFAIPSVSGTPSSFQVGLIALDAGDGLNVTYGGVFGTSSQALLDTNLPATGSSLFQVAAFLVSTDVSGHINPIVSGGILDRRPFLNLGGGGSGGASSILVDYITEFQSSNYSYLNTCIFSADGSTFIDNASTGVLDLVTNEFAFSVSGQTFVSTQNLSSDFLSGGFDVNEATLRATWDINLTDTAANYFLSRNGGVDYQAVSMTRINNGADYVGRLIFANTESLSILSSYVSGNINSSQQFNSTSGQFISEPFTLSNSGVAQQAQIFVNKVGSPGGTFTLNIIKDSAGSPSSAPNDVLVTSPQVVIANLPAGQSLVTQTLNPTVLPAGSYHLVVEPDSVYRSSFVSGVTEIDAQIHLGAAAAANLKTYDGTNWTTQTNKQMIYYISGRTLDLRAKIIAGTNGVKLAAYAVEYGPNSQFITQKLQQQVFVVNGSSNTNTFAVTNFLPNPFTLKIYQVETGQVFTGSAFSVNGQNVTFPLNSFNLPGQTITLIFDQTQGAAIDTSDANAANILGIQNQLVALGNQLDPFKTIDTSSNLISVPFTTIVNRMQVVDPSNSLAVNFGTNRITTAQIYPIQNEVGSNGEQVFGVLNDTLGYVRFVGGWQNQQNAFGQYISNTSSANTDFCEITFYGTGLNALVTEAGSGYDTRATVDGGSEGGNIYPNSGSFSNPITGRNYNTNQVVNVANGLALGVHTVKLRNNNGSGATQFFGFEILSEVSTLKVNTGNYYVNATKLTNSSLQSPAYASGFENGTLGTKGGHVAVYLKSDGTIGKAVTPTDTTQLTLTSASHANEEIVRTFFPREFGAGRSDDFSTYVATQTNRSFTLDDGTTTLTGFQVRNDTANEGVRLIGANTGLVTITFIGTGLDVVKYDTNGAVTNTTGCTVYLNGASIGTLSATAYVTPTTLRIVSGLPYGTHVVKIVTGATNTFENVFTKFIVYQPKMPSLPTGAVLLGDYNIVANFAAHTNSGQAYEQNIGVLTKYPIREVTYVAGGAWSVLLDTQNLPGGYNVDVGSPTTSNYYQFVFYGTGFDTRNVTSNTTNGTATVTINGLLATTANFPGLTANVLNATGGAGFNTSTGVWSTGTMNAYSTDLIITGLTLGYYTVKVTYTTGGTHFGPCSIDIITPVHSYKSNLYADLQNTLPIGSQAISDDRKLSVDEPTETKAWAQAVAVSGSPSTTSTSLIPAPDMSLTIKTQGGPIEVYMDATVLNNTSTEATYITLFVDGVQYGHLSDRLGTGYTTVTNSMIVPVSAGVHKVDMYWKVSGGTGTLNSTERLIKVREI